MAYNIGTIQRQLSSLIEDFKRTRNTWDEINSHAFPTANKLSNSIIQSRYADESEYWHPLLTFEFQNIIQQYEYKMQTIIKKQHDQLVDLVQKMEKQHSKMQNQFKDLYSICLQVKKVHGDEFLKTKSIYKTCPLDTYRKRMKELVEMYSKELETKKRLVSDQGFASIQSKDEAMVLLSIWINQPSIVMSIIEEWDDLCTVEMDTGNRTKRY
ncbi:hypothetical protein RMATCC62417_07609 [Rhizopus microsporus]|nr:hypothetical protein RMATCC62417_07609 [Rhizopus microsporus]CEJ04739.1 hypothetical protein RMCBS344292_18693 [Rhizopus microsporus]